MAHFHVVNNSTASGNGYEGKLSEKLKSAPLWYRVLTSVFRLRGQSFNSKQNTEELLLSVGYSTKLCYP
jgi:hypothetical protein